MLLCLVIARAKETTGQGMDQNKKAREKQKMGRLGLH